MQVPVKRKWVVVSLMAVVLPISLLATLRLTGILPEPPTPEIIMVDPIRWNIDIPLHTMQIDQVIRNSYNGDVRVDFNVLVDCYVRQWDRYYNQSGFGLTVVANTNIANGFIHSMVIKFSQTDSYAFMNIFRDPELVEAENLEIKRIDSQATDSHEGSVVAIAKNQPSYCFQRVNADWVLTDQNDKDHWITLSLEATYFNGTTYLKTIIPLCLGIVTT